MTPKQKVEKLSNNLKCTIEDRGDEILIDAPIGYVFEGGIHQLVASKWDDETKANLWADLLERITFGLDKCDDIDCDICRARRIHFRPTNENKSACGLIAPKEFSYDARFIDCDKCKETQEYKRYMGII